MPRENKNIEELEILQNQNISNVYNTNDQNDVSIQADKVIETTKQKRQQTEAQKLNTLKMRERLKEAQELKKQEKLRQEEEERKRLEEKIVKKAISIKKKQIKKEIVLDNISDDDDDIIIPMSRRLSNKANIGTIKKVFPKSDNEIKPQLPPKPKYIFV